jgi:integrase
VWHVVKECARKAAIENLAPHDVRRTWARLCRDAGGELEQIQFLSGHVSVQTTERYLGCKQRFKNAVNDRIGIEPNSHQAIPHSDAKPLVQHAAVTFTWDTVFQIFPNVR